MTYELIILKCSKINYFWHAINFNLCANRIFGQLTQGGINNVL